MKEVGLVKWFNNAQGFGFILDQNNKDVFVHYTAIKVDGYKTLLPDQKVSFVRINGKIANEFAATDVEIIS